MICLSIVDKQMPNVCFVQVDPDSVWENKIESPYFNITLTTPELLDIHVDIDDVDDLFLAETFAFCNAKNPHTEFRDFELSSCWYVERVSANVSKIHVVFPYASTYGIHIKVKKPHHVFDEHEQV